jgi:hypothetical protein
VDVLHSVAPLLILAKLVVFSPNDLFDDRLCNLIPMLCPAAVTTPMGISARQKT